MKKKSIIILCLVIAICAIGLVSSYFIVWPVDSNDASGDIAKATRFSREQVSEKLSNMEELLQTDSAFKDGIVAAQVVMQTRAIQFASLVDMSNEVASDIPAYADVLKDMKAALEIVTNANNSLAEAGGDLNAALEGKECPDLAQSTINASLAYMTLQKQNKLADRFIDTTDKYLETAQGDDRLKFVRDQWLEYQQMTAALDGDKALAEVLAKKGNLLSGEKALAAVENLDLNAKIVVLQNCMIAQRMNVPTQIGSVVSPNVLESEISSVLLAQKEVLAGRKIDSHNAQKEALAHRKIDSHNAQKEVLAGRGPKIDPHNAQKEVLAHRKIDSHNAQKEVLAHRKIDSYNALMLGGASKVMEAFNTSMSNVANNSALNQRQNIALGQRIGLVISQVAIGNRPTVSLIPDL